jgi:uncharacterized membrane protein
MAGSNGGAPGVGKGRRMPVQQSVDIGVPIETVYNQWTQFEDWPSFMHRVTRVTQEDDCTVSFATKIWAKTKEFTAKIETQRPNERIKWSVSQGLTHTGVVTFHELAPNLTRVLLTFDVQPGSLIEKAARGMRHVKRAARADLHRFKAFIELAGIETGAWRGTIEDGELVEEHDPSYDEQREYGDVQDLGAPYGEQDEDEPSEDDEQADDDEAADEGPTDEEAGEEEPDEEEAGDEQPKAKPSRRRRQSRNGGQEDDRDEAPTRRRTRNPARASSASSASRSGNSSGSRSGSSGRSRSSASRRSGGA